MNLRDFLSHRNVCPLCSSSLSLALHSRKRQKVRIIDDRLLITFQMTSLRSNSASYEVGYSINPNDNSFFMEFYSRNGKRFETIPLSLIDMFKEFNQNLSSYRLYKHCNSCKEYTYESNKFLVDLQKQNFGDLFINVECFVMNKDDKVFGLVNNYNREKSILTVGKRGIDLETWNFSNHEYVIETALINFVSKEETLNRLNKLLLFS